jgi:hypothetical protein
VFITGVLMIVGGAVMIAAGVVGPEAARFGLIGGGLGVGLSGLLLAYLDAPSKGEKPPPGSMRGKATILDASMTPGSVSGYQMVELTLEVWPKKGGTPFQVKRKFSAGHLGLGPIEKGRELKVLYDPADPEKLELA